MRTTRSSGRARAKPSAPTANTKKLFDELDKAKDQLLKTLAWRATTKPLELLQQAYNRDKFAGLGYVTAYHKDETGAYNADEPETKEVFTWNVYGNTKSIDKTFGDLQE